MSKRIFSDKEIKILNKNINVKNVSNKSITYTDSFKNEFICKYNNGILPREIFEEAGFAIDIVGIQRVHEAAKRWRKSFKTTGTIKDNRSDSSGRPLKRELSLEEKLTRLEAKNKLLEAENELLKKAELIERGLIIKLKD